MLLAGVGMAYGHGHALQGGVDPFSADMMKKALLPMRAAFLAELAFLGASLIFLGSMGCLLFRNCCGECSPMALIRKCRAAKAEGGAE